MCDFFFLFFFRTKAPAEKKTTKKQACQHQPQDEVKKKLIG